MEYKRGEIYFAELGENGIGSEQNGRRPVLIVQNNIGNKFSPTVIVVCITSKLFKNQIPTHVLWEAPDNSKSLILCEQIKTIDKLRLREYVATLPPMAMERVNRALRLSIEI